MEEVNSWTYRGEALPPDLITEDVVGFIYVITNTQTGRSYVGQKKTWRVMTRPPLKGKTRKRKAVVASDWQNYYSSGEEVQRQLAVHGPSAFKRDIIHLAYSKGMLNYLELHEQIMRGVLLTTDYDNGILQMRINKIHVTGMKDKILECVKDDIAKHLTPKGKA